ncbi:hypothetical protein M3Y99_00870700 [Aphelenchoides fujianensis]|nr:hypothetical protein M3Y99_00870700 [Aphelenchoides fujianensis]
MRYGLLVLLLVLAFCSMANAARFFMRHHPYIIAIRRPNRPEEPADYFQRNERGESVLHSLVFSPNLRRFTRNTDDLKRSEFQRTGGTILLG